MIIHYRKPEAEARLFTLNDRVNPWPYIGVVGFTWVLALSAIGYIFLVKP